MSKELILLLALTACGGAVRPEPPKDPSKIQAARVSKLQERAVKDLGCEAREVSITPVTLEDVGGQSAPVLADASCSKSQRYRYSWGDMAWYPTYADDEGVVPKRK